MAEELAINGGPKTATEGFPSTSDASGRDLASLVVMEGPVAVSFGDKAHKAGPAVVVGRLAVESSPG